MTIWSQFVCTPNIDAASYVDDRTFWHVGESGPTRFMSFSRPTTVVRNLMPFLQFGAAPQNANLPICLVQLARVWRKPLGILLPAL